MNFLKTAIRFDKAILPGRDDLSDIMDSGLRPAAL
jgi:hypothetical protein